MGGLPGKEEARTRDYGVAEISTPTRIPACTSSKLQPGAGRSALENVA